MNLTRNASIIYKAPQTQRYCNALQAKHKRIQIKHNAMWGEFTLSLSLVR